LTISLLALLPPPACRAAAPLLLVANKGDASLSIVDTDSGRQMAAVPEGAVTGHEVAASPDGRFAFVPIYGSSGVGQPGTDGRILQVIDLERRCVVGTIDFGLPVRPHRPVFGPRDGLLYVTTELSRSVTVIDPVSRSIVGTIPTGQEQSHMLAISSDGTRGYTANVKSGSVSVLDLKARSLVTVIPVSAVVQRVALSADDRWVFTADETKLRLVAIDTRSNAVAHSIALPGIGFGIAAAPDGKSMLVTCPALKLLCEVDLATMRLVRTLELPKAPQEILVRPDGAVAYVSCDSSRQVAVVDMAKWAVSGLIAVGPMDDGLAWAVRE
jgi:YVTN family beta-propeller protein